MLRRQTPPTNLLLKISTNDHSASICFPFPSLFFSFHSVGMISVMLIVTKLLRQVVVSSLARITHSRITEVKVGGLKSEINRSEMNFPNMDFKFNFTDPSFPICRDTKKAENVKSFVNCELLSKRTPKCARCVLAYENPFIAFERLKGDLFLQV